MKKFLAVVLAISLAGLAACGSESPASPTGSPETQPAAEVSATETPALEAGGTAGAGGPDYGPLYYTYGDCSFGIFDEASWVMNALGEPLDSFEAESCAYQGSDYFYYYDGLDLCVNEIDGIMRVTGIVPTDDTVQNPQGVRIGMDVDKALELMGLEYSETGGVYSFTYGSTLLMLQASGDGTIAAIEYTVA